MVDDIRELVNGLYASWSEGVALYEKFAEEQGLSYPELIVLYAVYTGSARTQRDISQRYGLTKQTVNGTVKRFLNEGHLAAAGAADRRQKVLRLTEAGRVYAASVAEPLCEIERRVFRQIGRDRLEEMRACSDGFNALFAKEMEERKSFAAAGDGISHR